MCWFSAFKHPFFLYNLATNLSYMPMMSMDWIGIWLFITPLFLNSIHIFLGKTQKEKKKN